tara:strand:- start:6738 stop:7283 length:546 start_codon:yes stop_codon:yes gene_type:complete
MCVADFNGDGRVDIIVTPAAGGAFTMFRNDGQMQFTDVSATSGLGVHAQARCIQAADIDNDGDQDVFVGGVMLPQKLFINDGTGVFTEEAALRGLVHAEDNNCASFGDYDRDGWIDLAVGNRLSTSGAPGANCNRRASCRGRRSSRRLLGNRPSHLRRKLRHQCCRLDSSRHRHVRAVPVV